MMFHADCARDTCALLNLEIRYLRATDDGGIWREHVGPRMSVASRRSTRRPLYLPSHRFVVSPTIAVGTPFSPIPTVYFTYLPFGIHRHGTDSQ